MRHMTPAKRQAFVERLCDLAGVPVISKETVAAIDDCYRRSLDGERLSDDEISAIKYAVAAMSNAQMTFPKKGILLS
jgi:hypothetical protein